MSLFDLRDVCMVIGSLETLDLPMVVDLIGIFVLKGPYCTLTMTDWFLQALSVIPRGSRGDVARRFTMIRWASPKMWFRSHTCCGPTASCEPLRVTQVLVSRFPHGNKLNLLSIGGGRMEGPNCYFGLGGPKNYFRIIILSFANCVDRSDLIVDRDYDGATSTRSVLGKCVYLVTLAISLFDLQDVCIAIGPIATLDLPMVVDLIGIYGLKGPYCTLTTTNWFLQPPPPSSQIAAAGRRPTPPPSSQKIRSGQFDEENPSTQISSGLLVQADEGVSYSVVDLIGVIYRSLP
ncbi:hypothetical protein F511_08058 [Dorcoceras hygrometricum]|uniref:Uncharacterized protein n=1 Tax=Dorcoceras hygrometricum TaxID=472368 RepID=A0A2Z7DCG5_9LAMI|nr:hypothetical protein F511_08058 [Dorcoceras hygrometricum]